MKFFLTLVLIPCALTFSHVADAEEIESPDGKTKVTIEISNGLRYAISYENKLILNPSVINLLLGNGTALSGKLAVGKLTRRNNNSVILSPVPEKRKHIPDIYNEITIRFKI